MANRAKARVAMGTLREKRRESGTAHQGHSVQHGQRCQTPHSGGGSMRLTSRIHHLTHHTAPTWTSVCGCGPYCVCPTAAHGPFHPSGRVLSPHMWTSQWTAPAGLGPRHPTVAPRHTWTHPSSQTQTHTDTPSPEAAGSRMLGPGCPRPRRHTHQAHWAWCPHCHAAT